MKIKHLLSIKKFVPLAFACMAFTANAQKRCFSDEVMLKLYEQDPSLKAKHQLLDQQSRERDALSLLNGKSIAAKTASSVPIYTIPVVFHVLHTGGSENISDAQILDAMDILNDDYQIMNTDTNQVVNPFKNNIGDVRFKFVLATKDPNGNCTNGIVRHIDPNTDWTGTLAEYAYTWPRGKYLNIYVVKTITIGSNAAGYTYRPGSAPSIQHDAIVCLHDYVGSIGTSSPFRSRTLTHEVGHWFDLPHVWSALAGAQVATTCGDEGITDTPITRGYVTCPNGTVNAQICNPGTAENYQNYMDYSYCTFMFTNGQVTRMHNAINSTTAERNSLSTPTNLIATGVVSPAINCPPVAEFMSTATGGYTICSGQTLNQMKDFSYNSTPTSWLWTATNGATLSTPTSSTTNIYFPTAGQSIVTLSVSNANGGTTKSRTVTVVDAAVTATDATESFEAGTTPANWSVVNPSGVQWANTAIGAYHGTRSFFLDGTISASGQQDMLVTPVMNFAANPTQSLTFVYAYRRKTASHNDVFKVQLSNDCGGSWKDVFAPSPATMANASGGTTTTPYVPAAGEWKKVDVTSHPNYFQYTTSNAVMARFFFEEGAGGFGNRLFIDSINLVAPYASDIGINELTNHLDLNVSPNPTKSSANISFVLSNNATIKVAVIDITGKIVIPQQAHNLTAGSHNIVVNENGILNKGIYIVNVEYNGTQMARKLVIE